MALEISCHIKLALRFRSSSGERESGSGKDKRPFDEERKDRLQYDTIVPKELATLSLQASSHQNEASDWVVIQGTSNNSPSNCSGESSDLSVGHEEACLELTFTNVRLLDTLNDSPPGICHAADRGGHRRCHRRCPKCRRGSIKTRTSSGTCNLFNENAGHLDPWAPVQRLSYDNDIVAVGAWDQANIVADATMYYDYPATI